VNSKAKRTAVTITGVYDFSTFPNVSGTFTTTGALYNFREDYNGY
jgi:hypothetical protein